MNFNNQMSIFDFTREPIRITKPIRLIELFAGYGSQAMALKRIGAKFEHYRVVEFDKYAIASYNAVHGTNFPTMDITKVHAEDLNICDAEAFTYLLTYSFPCTDLSVAGKQAGMSKGSGTRSGLLWEVERILTEIRDGSGELPQILFMENVPQVHGKKNIDDFKKWLEFLESLGYTNYWQDLNAKNYGVAQNRNRCFMFSFLGNYSYNFPQPIPLKKKLKDYLEDNVDEKYYINNEKADKLIKQLIDNGTLPNTIPKSRAEQSRAEQSRAEQSRLALTEQSISRNEEKLQTASRQDMTQESQTCGQKETVLLKAVDLSINNPKEKIIANCILSHISKDGNAIGKYASLNTGVVECKKLKL